MRRKSLIIILLAMVAMAAVWFYDKNSTISLSKNFDVSSKSSPTTLSFDIKEASIYTIKIDFSKTDDKNKKELFSLPLTFLLQLAKDENQTLIDDVYTINGVSGQNKDGSAYREISTILFEPGKYTIQATPINDEPKINEYGLKLTITRTK